MFDSDQRIVELAQIVAKLAKELDAALGEKQTLSDMVKRLLDEKIIKGAFIFLLDSLLLLTLLNLRS